MGASIILTSLCHSLPVDPRSYAHPSPALHPHPIFQELHFPDSFATRLLGLFGQWEARPRVRGGKSQGSSPLPTPISVFPVASPTKTLRCLRCLRGSMVLLPPESPRLDLSPCPSSRALARPARVSAPSLGVVAASGCCEAPGHLTVLCWASQL